MGTADAMPQNRILLLDTLRGFAASWVVLFHLNEIGIFPPNAYQAFVKHGHLGVQIFFVLSGYSIHASLLRAPPIRKFLRRRFWRIYPPYIASLALIIVFVVFRELTTGINDLVALPRDAVGWIEVLTLTTKPLGRTSPLNVVCWTLTYEVAFYLWLTIALVVPRLRWPLLFGPVILSLAWHNAPIFFIDQWCLFGLGVAIAEWHSGTKALAPVFVILCLADALLHRSIGETVASTATFTLVLMAISQKFDWLNRIPLLHRAGDWSYSLYLTHVPIGFWLALRVDNYPRLLSATDFPMHIAIDAFAFSLCCGFAVLFWTLVEKPSIRIAHTPAAAPASMWRTLSSFTANEISPKDHNE